MAIFTGEPKQMDLRVSQEPIETGTRRVIHLDDEVGKGRGKVEVFYEMVGEHDIPAPRLLDGFLFAVIFYAMQTGQNVYVHGSLSADALRNLNELQEAWCLWKGNRYTKVKIDASQITDYNEVLTSRSAIAAFSGGVDSIFTLLRHATGDYGAASYPLRKDVLLVHGFDVPLQSPEHLDALKERTAPLLKELNLGIRVIRTNLKELGLQDWIDTFGAQLASCLHNYSHEFCYGLVGSSAPYDALLLPWGSNPATDHLLSGAALRIVHDGAGYSRIEKVKQIARNTTAAHVVKVCWEGKQTFKNCGNCEKCIRTRLSFLAVGVPNPPCFETPLDRRHIKELRLTNDFQCAELVRIGAYAKGAGLKGEWLADLQECVNRYRSSTPIRKYARKFKTAWDMATDGEWEQIAIKLKRLR
jgi:hypothetical protein